MLCVSTGVPTMPAVAQDPPLRERLVTFRFEPVARAQIAVWVEREESGIFHTLLLTRATATYGIGNRPGASQMNSGFRWPYGRREGALPVWAHARATATGVQFRRVVFNGRESEGLASVSFGEPRNTRDDYFCLSFDASTTRREALDAVSCASVFNSNKGRYLTEPDVAAGYAEPWEEPHGSAMMRALPLRSLYPPRRDRMPCDGGCDDHADVGRYAADAATVMPEIDEVTTATLSDGRLAELQLTVPPEWPDGSYVAWIEVNVEGDYNEAFDDTTHPTPRNPGDKWDYWAINYGYPYRGQPSIVYRLPFTLASSGGDFATGTPHGYGDVHGLDGRMTPMDSAITDDPATVPGSGADRLGHMPSGARFEVTVTPTNVCGAADPPPECEMSCGDRAPCPSGFVCGPAGRCVGVCDLAMPPPAVGDLELEQHPDEKQSHHFAVMRFVAPAHDRTIREFEVRVSPSPITDLETYFRAPSMPANAASLDSVELVVPTDVPAGEAVEVTLGGLVPEAHYWVGVRPIDTCNDAGEVAVAEVSTTKIHFTTVSPCFVATAAYGSALAGEVGALRRFRDRHLLTHAPGQAWVAAYDAVGPLLADVVRESDALRLAARTALTPAVFAARILTD